MDGQLDGFVILSFGISTPKDEFLHGNDPCNLENAGLFFLESTLEDPNRSVLTTILR